MSTRIFQYMMPVTAAGFALSWMALVAGAGPGYDSVSLLVSLPTMLVFGFLVALGLVTSGMVKQSGLSDTMALLGLLIVGIMYVLVCPVALFVQIFHGLSIEIVLAGLAWVIPLGLGVVVITS